MLEFFDFRFFDFGEMGTYFTISSKSKNRKLKNL